jgi:serine/threonine protein kinase
MAMKRQRGMDAAPNFERPFSPFGKESVSKITRKDGNPTFARGAFGELSIAIRQSGETDPCQFVAVKILERALVPSRSDGDEKQLSEDVLSEVFALQSLTSHENIVSLLAMYNGKQMAKLSLSLVFPYCPCDLHTSLEWRRRTFRPLLPFDVVKAIAQDVFAALNHCHNSGILHRDLKPGNLLVSSTGAVKLCDFGIAKQFLDAQKSIIKPTPGATGTKGLCTLYYRPPEVLFGGQAGDPSVDMYSAGTVVAELITGRTIFQGRNVLDQLSLIFDLLGTPTDTSWPSCKSLPDYGKLTFKSKMPQPWETTLPRTTEDSNLHNLLSRLIALDPSKRLSSKEALEHAWLSSFNPVPAPLETLRKELIPPQLREPILLSPENKAVASSLAIKLAGKRRTFLTSQSVSLWNGPEILEESIAAVCASLRSAQEMDINS